jgi:hypothetical protein
MNKLFAVVLCASALAACSDMPWNQSSSGNRAETRNSTDANKSGNRAAVSPGGGSSSGGSAAGAGAGGASSGGSR